MSIKINNKILCIPPYISTSWSHVIALHMKDHLLSIDLTDGQTIVIPGLNAPVIDQIFSYHAAYLDQHVSHAKEQKEESLSHLLDNSSEPALRLVFGSLDGLGTIMQHNAEQANAPDLPSEILQKIHHIAKVITLDETLIPKAEPFCNCFHCQIARAISPQGSSTMIEEESEEVVNEEELQFQQWNIIQTGDKVFSVTNRLDKHEKYSVYLGEPVGCTCGKQGCEHILAVLKS